MTEINSDVANFIVKTIENKLLISYDKDIIIDPCASSNNLISSIGGIISRSLHFNKTQTYDNVEKLDFLTLDFDKYNKTFLSGLWFDDIHVISIPDEEFIIEYIEVCSKFAQSISFVLPKKIFIFPDNYKLIYKTDLPLLGPNYMFQIWIKTDF